MPGSIFVAGPVLDQAAPFAAKLYVALEHEAARQGWSLSLPVRDERVDYLEPQEFVKAIEERIGDSQCVVTVIGRRDPSAAVEATMASYLGKEQVVVMQGSDAPRILAGLPGVLEVRYADDPDSVIAAVRQLVG